jgi:hypothetical protein
LYKKSVYKTEVLMNAVKWVGLLAGDALLFGLLFYFFRTRPERFEIFMMSAAPAAFLAVCGLLLYALFSLRHKIAGKCRAMYPVLPHLAVVLAIGFTALFGLSKNNIHLIWYDEDIYEAQACNTASSFQSRICGYGIHEGRELVCTEGPYNKEPVGYPTLLAIVYKIFGCTEKYNFFFQGISYLLLIVSVAAITLLLWNNPFQSVCAAGMTALVYPVLLWFRTMAIEPTAMVMECIGVFSCLVFYRNPGDRRALLLCLAGLTLASMVRPEGALIWVLFVAGGLLFFRDKKAFFRKIAGAAPLILLLMMFQLLHFMMFSHFSWGNDAGGQKFVTEIIPNNLKTNLLFFFNNKYFPLLITCAALFSLLPLSKTGRMVEKTFLGLWFLIFFFIFIPFYAGSYEYGMDSRYVLLCLPPVAILASLAMTMMPKSLAAMFIIGMTAWYFTLLPKQNDMIWDCYADHQFGQELLQNVEKDALVVTPNPQMTMMIGVNTLYDGQLEQYLHQKPEEMRRFSKIYFYYSFWCNAAPRDGRTRSYCYDAIEKYHGRLVNRFPERNFEYALYELDIPRR